MIVKVVRAPRMVRNDDVPVWTVQCVLSNENAAFVPVSRYLSVPIDNALAGDIVFDLMKGEPVLLEVDTRRRW